MDRLTAADERLAIVNRRALSCAPGTSAEHSDSTYYLLGARVQKVTHHPGAPVIKTQIFDPLHLRQTSDRGPPDKVFAKTGTADLGDIAAFLPQQAAR